VQNRLWKQAEEIKIDTGSLKSDYCEDRTGHALLALDTNDGIVKSRMFNNKRFVINTELALFNIHSNVQNRAVMLNTEHVKCGPGELYTEQEVLKTKHAVLKHRTVHSQIRTVTAQNRTDRLSSTENSSCLPQNLLNTEQFFSILYR